MLNNQTHIYVTDTKCNCGLRMKIEMLEPLTYQSTKCSANNAKRLLLIYDIFIIVYTSLQKALKSIKIFFDISSLWYRRQNENCRKKTDASI